MSNIFGCGGVHSGVSGGAIPFIGVGSVPSKPVIAAAIANPAAGAELVFTAPVPLQVVGLQAILGTSSADGQRTPFIVCTLPGGAACVVSSTPRGQPKSSAVQYQWGNYDVSGPMAAAVSCSLAGPLLLPTGATLSTFTVGGKSVGIGLDPADQYSFAAWVYVPL